MVRRTRVMIFRRCGRHTVAPPGNMAFNLAPTAQCLNFAGNVLSPLQSRSLRYGHIGADPDFRIQRQRKQALPGLNIVASADVADDHDAISWAHNLAMTKYEL